VYVSNIICAARIFDGCPCDLYFFRGFQPERAEESEVIIVKVGTGLLEVQKLFERYLYIR